MCQILRQGSCVCITHIWGKVQCTIAFSMDVMKIICFSFIYTDTPVLYRTKYVQPPCFTTTPYFLFLLLKTVLARGENDVMSNQFECCYFKLAVVKQFKMVN